MQVVFFEEKKMKTIKILFFSYLWGIIFFNLIAFLVWLNDPEVLSMDLPTILLTLIFSLVWPVALFGDFMASNNLFRKIIDIVIVIGLFGFGVFSEKLMFKIKNR